MNNFSFNNDNLKLGGTLFYPSDKKEKYPAILFIHGLTGEREKSFQYARALADLGFVCMLLDLRGHGTSEGDINTFSSKDFLSDVVVSYDYFLGVENIDRENISVVGNSFGGYLAVLLSTKRKIKNLALRVPANYPDETFNSPTMLSGGDNPDVMKWRKEPKQPTESYALKALHKFEGNILIIESEKDDRVPHQTILNYTNAVKDKSRLTYILMKDAPHSMGEGKFRDEVVRILVGWFKTKL